MEDKKVGVAIGVVLLDKEGKVMLGKGTDKEGTWRLPTVMLQENEEFEQAAMRAAMDAAGIKVDYIRVSCVNNDKTDSGHFVTVGVVSDRWSGEQVIKDISKTSEWAFFNLEDSPFPIDIPSAKVLINLKKGKFYFSN